MIKIIRESEKNGIHDIIMSGPRGVTVRSCGINRGETIARIEKEIAEVEQRLEWPDETRIDIIGTNGNDGDHYAQG